ncbi:Histidine kinase-, DNA gyrase B-, and HSP90-like ATPase [Winogradskyella jejuensis]|uniref:histidine kinase n=2 Tax=Winogradskyella jejuensis TaxID=1089305 RepID=A0A1M5M2U0_9FLAO|nr:Histidine kinase-, DNA gyrase B-, and HSP90-like ATPase [Winogradskyella jejuensis]
MVEKFPGEEGSVILVLLVATIFLALVTLGLILFFFFSRKKVIEKEREKANLKIEHQQKILQTSIAIQEEERKRIAQDLHDAISSKLNIVSLTTNVLLGDKEITKKQKETLEQILGITSTTLESSRKIAHDLLPPILEKFGLKAALEELFEEFSKNTNIDIQHDIEDFSLSESHQLHVFRIVQELINNSIRHGKADELVIFIQQKDSGYSLRYQDNGVGFDVDEVKQKAGIGLQNISSRVRILNGSLEFDSQINKGSTFLIRCKYGK